MIERGLGVDVGTDIEPSSYLTEKCIYYDLGTGNQTLRSARRPVNRHLNPFSYRTPHRSAGDRDDEHEQLTLYALTTLAAEDATPGPVSDRLPALQRTL